MCVLFMMFYSTVEDTSSNYCVKEGQLVNKNELSSNSDKSLLVNRLLYGAMTKLQSLKNFIYFFIEKLTGIELYQYQMRKMNVLQDENIVFLN